jgi:hypothetical protein
MEAKPGKQCDLTAALVWDMQTPEPSLQVFTGERKARLEGRAGPTFQVPT